MTVQRATPLTKSTFAYTELRRRIVRGEIPPGTRLDLNEMCEILQVSRMPVREALSQLDAQGLVEIRPQAATIVSELSAADLRDTYDARLALETLLAGAGAKHVDAELTEEMGREIERQRGLADKDDLEGFLISDRIFHDLLYERAQMPRTREMVLRLRDVADRYIYLFLQAASHRQESIAEHEQLLEHCIKGERAKIKSTIEVHVRRGREMLLEQFNRIEADGAADLGSPA